MGAEVLVEEESVDQSFNQSRNAAGRRDRDESFRFRREF